MPTLKSNNPKILACDPSFTAWGWAVFQNHTRIDSGCIKTEPSPKKNKVRKGDDRIRRIGELYDILLEVIQSHKIDFIVAELPHGSQNAQAAIMMGSVAAILMGFDKLLGIPVEWYTEDDAKKTLLGRKSASKADVIAAVEETFDDRITGFKYVQEAIADAMAIYNVAQKNSPTLKILLRR
jgi:Holliday junction resolvasome RuvABC endonuclease subunit